MPPKPSNNLSRPAKATVASFKTSKGSEYTVDGISTTRNKSYHPEHGPADVGMKPRSLRTVYVDEEAQFQAASALGLDPEKQPSVKIEGDELVVRYKSGRDMNRNLIQREKRFPISSTPEKGMAPIEFLEGSSVHVGNEITEITHAPLTGPNSMPSKNSKRNLSPLARTGQQMTTDMMPGEGGFVESGSPTLQRSAASPITPAEKQSLLDTILRSRSRKKKAEAASRLKEIIKLEAEGLEPHFAQSGQNVLPSEREGLQQAYDRTAGRQQGLSSPIDAGRLDPSGNMTVAERAALNDIESRSLSRQAAKNVGAAGVAADVAGGTISAGALAGMTDKGGTISKGALASMANKGTVSKGALAGLAKATGKSVGFLTKAAGVLGWAGLAYTLYENTIGRRNDGRAEEATGLMDAGLQGLDRAPMAGEEAYGRLLPDIARESEAAGYAQDRSETSNLLSLDSLLTQNQQALRSSAQVTPISMEEYMLRVKAELAARGA